MQGFYFKPTLSARKHKCSGNEDGTIILFLKVCLVAQLCLNLSVTEPKCCKQRLSHDATKILSATKTRHSQI